MIKIQEDKKPRNRVSLGMKCEDCIHYSKGPRKYERLCSSLGVEPFAPACPEFTPDLLQLAEADIQSLVTIAELASTLTQRQVRLLAFTFRNIDYIKKSKFEFGQTVVFSLDGKAYLENYFRGTVFGASKDGKLLYITSKLEDMNTKNCMLSLLTSDVLSMDQYYALREKLIKKGKLRAPAKKYSAMWLLKLSPEEIKKFYASLEKEPDKYEPPTLDTVPVQWLDSRQAGTLKRRKKPEKYQVKEPSTNKATDKSTDKFSVNRYGS
jgi:hypothetical protein